MQPGPIAKVSTFLRSPNTSPPLTPRKDNTGETIANCCLDCGIQLWLHKKIHFITGFNWTVLFDTEVRANNKHQR